jgi:amino acid adenylation domain-containing protein
MQREHVEGFRLSQQQRRVWQLQQADGTQPYRAVCVLHVAGHLEPAKLEAALRRIVSRHEILRTAFSSLPGMNLPLQVIKEESRASFEVRDLSGLDAVRQEEELEVIFEKARHAPFDYEQGTLLTTTLIKLAPQRQALLFALPSLCADAATLRSLAHQLIAAYDSTDDDGAHAEPTQYADVSEVFNELIESEDTEGGRAYWHEKNFAETLQLEPAASHLAATYATEFVPEFYAAAVAPHLMREINSYLHHTNVSPKVLLLTCWQVLLWKLTGKGKFITGVAYDGRTYEGLEDACGLFAKYLPVQSALHGRLCFEEALAQGEEAVREAEQWQDYFAWPEGDGLGKREAATMLSFFPICFDFEELPPHDTTSGLSVEHERHYVCFDRFEVRLSCTLRHDALLTEFYYNSSVYQREEIERLASRFHKLLEEVALRPQATLGELDVLSEDERRRLLFEFNDTKHDFQKDLCLHQLFEEMAVQVPDHLALISGDQQLTYAELDTRADQLARRLRAAGVRPEVRVAICAERSVEMVVGLLGVLKAGGAYVPLDPSYPHERLAYILEDTEARVLLVQKELESALPAHQAQVLYLDAEVAAAANVSGDRVASGVSPDNLAYVIYTSGSTGNPKGVLISHRSINNRLLWTNYVFPLTETDRVLQKTPYSFDASIWELFAPLLAGAVVVMARPGGHQDRTYLTQVIAEQQITVLQLVPTMLRVFLEEEGVAQACRGLRRMFCGGEALPPDLQDHFYSLLTADLINLYGPTESSIDATCWPCPRDNRQSIVPLGRPLFNIQIYILDKDMQPVPIGVSGELHIGGVSLARGYLNRPELTAYSFIPDPFSTQSGQRLYRTGDLARYLPDGQLEFLGRVDQQVKVRGFRIEPGEVEASLREHEGVAEVVVAARGESAGDKQLVAYVVAQEGAVWGTLVSELRQQAREKLPEYMIPSAFVSLDQLPRTLSGKVDFRALPEPERGRRETGGEYVSARTPVEEVLAGIWAEVLGMEQVGINDNFFDLGGHSLLVTQVMARVRVAFGVDLPLRNFFEARTLAQLAEMIGEAMKVNHNLESMPIQRASREHPLPLSFAQQRLWFLDQMEPGSPFYNIPAAVRLKGALDVSALEQTFDEIMRRHETLRTTFASVDGSPVQIISPHLSMKLEVVDLRALPEDEREREALRVVSEDARAPFDLTSGRLLRPCLLKLDEDDYLLSFTMHHIISDVWSRNVLIRELRELYTAFSRKQPSPLAELPLQYADFAFWQRHWLQGETLEAELTYWRKQLAGAPTVLELPTDRSRPPVQSLNGAQETLALPAKLLAELKSFSRREGATMFMTLLAAFDAFLYRYTGQEDIVVGSPIANRDRVELEGIIGFFTNTLVLRASVGDNPSFRELLKHVREVALGAYAHRDLPFETLVEALQPERDLSYPPLFQVMFVHQMATTESFELPGLTLGNVGVENGSAKFDLTLFVVEGSENLAAMLEYNSDLFDAATARRMLSQFENLLESVVADPEQRLLDLALLTESDRRQMLCEWNETTHHYPAHRQIHRTFEAQVERTPEAVAVTFGGEQLTYRELNGRANRLANYLQAQGVGADVLVGICMERSLDLIVSMLGVLKSGGAYVPLDAAYPKERLSFILEDARPPVLLTQERLKDKLPETDTKLVCLDTEWARMTDADEANPSSAVTGDNLAYIIFTSGSTGRPKGIAMRREPLFNIVSWQIADSQPGPGDKTLQFASLNFDISNLEAFSTWCTGGTLVLIPEQVRYNISSLLNFIAEEEIHRLFVPFVVLQQLVEVAESEGPIPCHLREVNTAGEQLQITKSLLSFFDKLENCVLHNHYGPSECHVVTAHTLDNDRRTWPSLPPIGRPIYNTQIYLLDRNMQPVPIGVSGELHIGGVSLARGYLNRPELTAYSFIPDPFSTQSGQRLYRTGDLARYLPDGQLEFLGRVDQQVKVRGFRIEPGEVEAALRGHVGVTEVVVMARGESAGDKQLVAYVVAREGVEWSALASELRQQAREKLPEYMIPSAFVLLDQLPLTTDGKVDRRALPEPERGRREASAEYIGARTPVEEVVAGIWAEVLGLEQVGINDNFFDLGGHSLLATRAVSRIREAFGMPFPLRRIFEDPTVAGLSQIIDETIKTERGLQTPPIERVPRESPLPLSFIQARTLFMAQLEGRPSFYNFEIRLRGPLNVDALEKSLSEVVRRHEILRTTFANLEGQVVQVVNPPQRIELPPLDLGELPETEREARAKQLSIQQGQQNFDLFNGPLLRLQLLRLAPHEHRLLFTIPHITCDRWSIGLLSQEIATLYDAFCQGRPSPLPELLVQYADFAVWERRWLQGEVLENALNYWKRQLRDAPPALHLPTDYPRPPLKSYRGDHVVFALPKGLSEEIDALSQRERCTRFMTLLAAFKTLLYRYTTQEDIVVGTAVAGRTQTGLEKLIGNFGTPLAMRTQLSGKLPFRELLRRVREVALEGYAYQDLPLDQLLEELQPELDPSFSPLIQVGFVVHNDRGREGVELRDLNMEVVSVEAGRSHYDLTLNLHHTAQGLMGSFEYSTALFDAATIKRITRHLQNLLEGIVANPDQRLADLPLLNADERRQLLAPQSESPEMATSPPVRGVHELFEAQAAHAPDAVALAGSREWLTYGELNRRANQVAHRLRALGVSPETPVGVLAESQSEKVVGLLGVLKAGGAYVLLDGSLPEDQLASILTDEHIALLLAQGRWPENISVAGVPVVNFDAGRTGFTSESAENLSATATGSNLACVVNTVNSGGRSKGVQLTHEALSKAVYWHREALALTHADQAVQAGVGHDEDAGVLLWACLAAGAQVHLFDDAPPPAPTRLRNWLLVNQISVACLSASLAEALLDADDAPDAPLRVVLTNGSHLRSETASVRPFELIKRYGPLECAALATSARLDAGEATPAAQTIGHPVKGTQVYLVDSTLNLLPAGVVGELCVGGERLARGYLNAPDLTAEKFIPHPFSDERGARLYRTGHLGRYLPQGEIEFLGEFEQQTTIRGFKVELLQVETAIKQHPSIYDVVVVTRVDGSGKHQLVAYVVPKEQASVDGDELREFLKELIPAYMLPETFVILDTPPMLPGGKVDRRNLPEYA